MLMISGLGQDVKVAAEPAPAPTSTPTRISLSTTLSKLRIAALSPELTKSITTAVISATTTDLYKQLQCLLNAAILSPIVQSKFAQWQTSDAEGWNLVQRWSPLDVDGVIKTGDSWIPRRESDTYALLSRTGISQFWMGDVYGFGPSWMATNAASLVKTLADFVGPGIAGPCDFPAIRAAATKAAADQAAADAQAAAAAAAAAQNAAAAAAAAEAARKAAEEAAILEHQSQVQTQLQEEISQQSMPPPGEQPSPGMMVEPAPQAATPTVSPLPAMPDRRWMKWVLIGGVVLGAGVLVALARR